MPPPLVVSFTKMQGAGNDFLVIDNRFYRFSDAELEDLARRWCPRRVGVGADGLLALNPPDPAADAPHDYRMRYLNADGSWATMCGNGARCLARFAVDAGMDGPNVRFATDAGMYRAEQITGTDRVRLWTPPPAKTTLDAPLDAPLPAPLDAVHTVWTGTEHLVALVDDPDAVDLLRVAPPLRNDPALAPAGANVNLVAPAGDNGLQVRTYEKGVEDETLSCGTGVLASAVIAWKTRAVESDPVTVHTKGGTLRVGHDATGALYLEGPVAFVYRGTIDVTV